MRRLPTAISVAFAASLTAMAADTLPPALEACAALEESAERLACYDRTVAQLAAGKDPDSKITARVKSLRTLDDGTLLIGLDNDQTWRQLSAGSLVLAPGDEVTISRAAFGSFRLAAPSNRYARVKRVR
jgi:hypothetical protein